MDQHIDFSALKSYLDLAHPPSGGLVTQDGKSRPGAKGCWKEIVRHGLPAPVRRTARGAADNMLLWRSLALCGFKPLGKYVREANDRDLVDLLDA
jgi:hypothetical protein